MMEPAYVYIPVLLSSSPTEHGRHRIHHRQQGPRQRVMRVNGVWTVMPSISIWRCVARSLRATLWA
jgi:hypothetical protein